MRRLAPWLVGLVVGGGGFPARGQVDSAAPDPIRPSVEGDASDRDTPRVSGALRAAVGPEIDTNARRQIELPDEPPDDTDFDLPSVVTDGLLKVVIDGGGRIRLGRGWELHGQLLAGAKRFVNESTEDQWAQLLSAGLAKRWGRVVIGTDGSFRISRMRRAVRNYSWQQARLQTEVDLGAGWAVGGWAGWFAYQFEPREEFTYSGPQGGVFGRYAFARPWTLYAWVDGWLKDYDSTILVGTPVGPRFCEAEEPDCADREDTELRTGIRVQWSGKVVGALGYDLRLLRSNSEPPLEDLDLHRVSGFVSVPVVWEILATARCALQLRFGDSPTFDLALGDEDENRNKCQLQVRRPITPALDFDIRYAAYWYRIEGGPSAPDLEYLRQTVFAGISFRTGSAGR